MRHFMFKKWIELGILISEVICKYKSVCKVEVLISQCPFKNFGTEGILACHLYLFKNIKILVFVKKQFAKDILIISL